MKSGVLLTERTFRNCLWTYNFNEVISTTDDEIQRIWKMNRAIEKGQQTVPRLLGSVFITAMVPYFHAKFQKCFLIIFGEN